MSPSQGRRLRAGRLPVPASRGRALLGLGSSLLLGLGLAGCASAGAKKTETAANTGTALQDDTTLATSAEELLSATSDPAAVNGASLLVTLPVTPELVKRFGEWRTQLAANQQLTATWRLEIAAFPVPQPRDFVVDFYLDLEAAAPAPDYPKAQKIASGSFYCGERCPPTMDFLWDITPLLRNIAQSGAQFGAKLGVAAVVTPLRDDAALRAAAAAVATASQGMQARLVYVSVP